MSSPGRIRVAGGVQPRRPLKAAVVANDDKATASERRGDASTPSTPFAIPYILLFILALPTVTGAWYWGKSSVNTFSTQGVKSTIPQYLLWLCLPLAVGFHVNRRGWKFYKTSVGLFVPFLLIGVAASFVGIFPITSLKGAVYWLAFVSAGVLVVGETRERTAIRVLFYAVLAELVLSILLAVLVKSVGTAVDSRASGGLSWRGVFEQRIPLSVVALWGLVLTLYRKEVGLIPTIAMLACSLLCLYKSHSAGTILALFAAGAFWIALIGLRRSSMPNAAKSAIMLLGCLAGLLAVLFLLPAVVGALGRDLTFTGRTTIWAAFLPKALQHPIIGQGPGSFTNPSPITGELYYRLINLGFIRTPHNTLIAILGEGGVFAVLAMFGMLAYVAFVLPFRDSERTSMICGIAAVSIMAVGLGETTMAFSPDLSTFFFVTLLALRAHGPQAVTAPEAAAKPKRVQGAAPGVASLGGGAARKIARNRIAPLGQLRKG